MERGRVRVEGAGYYTIRAYALLPVDAKANAPRGHKVRRWGWVVVEHGLNWYEMMDLAWALVVGAKVRGRLDDWWHRPALRTRPARRK